MFALIALLLFVRQDYDKAFVCATLGAIAWFLSYRVQMKDFVRSNESPKELDESLESNEEK